MATAPAPVVRVDPVTASAADSLIETPAVIGSDLQRRVSRLLLLRTLVATVVLALSSWLLLTGEQHQRPAVWLQSAIIAVTYLTSIGFGILLRRGFEPGSLARPMQAADLVVTSMLVYVTGGAQSPYTFLYALSVVGAGALSYRRGAAVVTGASLLAMTTVSLLAWVRAIDLPLSVQAHPWDQSPVELIRTLGINFVALIGVGALSFIFGDQLERGAETLATTRKAAADLLTLHQDIIRSLSSGLITIAKDGTVLTANQSAAEILRHPVELLIGQSIDTLMPGLIAQLAGSGELRRADLAVDTGGLQLTIGVTVSPLRDVRDQVLGRVVSFQDLTELRRLEGHARRSERLATVGRLAAGVAHEIRNPLASISGSIELLRQAPQASDEDRQLMTIVHREIQRLNVLIGDLLDYANPRPRQPVDFDLGIVIDETLQVAKGDQAFVEVEVTSEIDRPLPIHADPAKLRQVIWNLLRNAAHAAAAGGKHVRVEARVAAESTTISVTDDGHGIRPDQIAQIFDPFFTTKTKGTGLGLAMCHAMISEHGGRIDVESEVGKGTTMLVRIPRAGAARA